MKSTVAIAFVLLWGSISCSGNTTAEEQLLGRDLKLHSRQKRYIVFPKGSSLQLLLEVLSHVPTQYRLGVGPTLQVAWPLPSEPQSLRSRRSLSVVGAGEALVGNRRKIFRDVSDVLDYLGADGRQCVLKALCESGQRTPSKKEFLTEILHKIFSMEAVEDEVEDNHEDKAYRKAHQSVNQNCQTLYPECDISFFNSVQ